MKLEKNLWMQFSSFNKAVFPFQYRLAKNVFSGVFPLNFDVRYPNEWDGALEVFLGSILRSTLRAFAALRKRKNI